jgi:hypothetical protein
MKEFTYDELLLLKHAVQTLYLEERGEGSKVPFYENPMSAEQWETLLDLKRKLRRMAP